MNTKRRSFNIVQWLKRIAIGQAIIVNILIFAFAITVLSGNIFGVLDAIFVQPSYERWTSQWDLFDIQPEHTVFLGDSLIEYGAWEELFPDEKIVNRGIVGDRTTGVLARLDQIATGQPARVFLMIGTNDLFNGTPENEIVANIMQIIDDIHTTSPQTDIYVQSILPRQAVFNDRVKSLNTTLETAIASKATWGQFVSAFSG